MKILLISRYIPYQANSGITIRIHNLLKCLSRICEINCVYLVEEDEGNAAALKECRLNVKNFLIEVKRETNPLKRYVRHLFELFNTPGHVKDKLNHLLAEEKPDVVWLEFGYICHLVSFLSTWKIPVLYGSHNSQFQLDYNIWKTNTNISYKIRMAPFVLCYYIHERLFFKLPDAVFCISQRDIDYYRNFVRETKLHYLPFFFDESSLASCGPLEVDHPYICIVGSLRAYQNYSAVIFTLEELWPAIQKEHQQLRLYVVGELPPAKSPEHKRLMEKAACAERVVLTGMVESVIPYVKGARANITPLLIGSGVRTKIIESAACRTPVVSTAIGAEGLPFSNGESICIADEAGLFVAKVLELVNDPRKRTELAEKAYLTYSRELSLDAGVDRLTRFLRNYGTLPHEPHRQGVPHSPSETGQEQRP